MLRLLGVRGNGKGDGTGEKGREDKIWEDTAPRRPTVP